MTLHDLFTPQRALKAERAKQDAGHSSIEQRLGEAVLRELNRAFDYCEQSFTGFTAEHVFRACPADVRLILDIEGNRNVLGSLFKARAKSGQIVRTGRTIPAIHKGSRGRQLPEWRRAA